MTAWMRSRRPSLDSTLPTCVFTVWSLTTIAAAISALERPRARCSSVSRSRAVRTPSRRSSATAVACSGREVYAAIRSRATEGASSESPAATTRTACTRSSRRTSLRRKPLAPACSASYTYASESKVVSMTVRQAVRALISRQAPMPSRTGIRMSSRATSGSSRRTASTACAPSPASATTSMSGWASRIIANPLRTSSWSSATTTRIVNSPPPPRALPARGGA